MADPWNCVDCLDSGVAGRGTNMRICHCEQGKEMLRQAYEEAAEGLDPEVKKREFELAGVKLTGPAKD